MRVWTLLLSLTLTAAAAGAQDGQAVWYWFGACPDTAWVGLEVRLDGRLLERATVPLCHVRRGAITQRQYARQLHFTFAGGRVFRGEYRTAPIDTIQGDIWGAGGDPDVMILGVDLSPRRSTPAKSQVLLNTIHLLYPTRTCTSELEAGLTVRTYPIHGRPKVPAL